MTKTMTEQQFIDMVCKQGALEAGFETTQISRSAIVTCEEYDAQEGWLFNLFTISGFELVYQECYEHPIGKPSAVTVMAVEEEYQLNKCDFDVLDEDGDVLDWLELAEIVAEHTAIKDLDSSIVGEDTPEEIDVDEDDDMETFTLQNDNAADIKFTGELIASVSSRDNDTTRWTELALYKTKGGKYVVSSVGVTKWQGERDRYAATAFGHEEEVVEHLGYGWLAKELYEKAGIDASEAID